MNIIRFFKKRSNVLFIPMLIFVVFSISCQEKDKKEIDSVKVWYYNGIFDRAMAVGCDEIVYLPEKVDILDVLLEDGSYLPKQAVILESIITDKEVLQEIAIELSKYKTVREDYVDARIKCHIIYKNKQIDSLCIGSNPINGVYNNQPVKLTNRLVYLIRKNCDFYSWIGIDCLKYFDELNDTTFVRSKIKSISGMEY